MMLPEGLSLTAAVTAVLFASTSPVELSRLAAHFELSTDEILITVEKIKNTLDSEDFGFRLNDNDGRYSLSTKPEYGESTAAFLDRTRASYLSNAALETLAIVAYNQPATKTYISQIRGVSSSEIVESLVDKGLLTEAGRLDLPGRPMSYVTTDKFLTVFGLDSLEALPKQESFINADDSESADIVEEYEQISLTDTEQ